MMIKGYKKSGVLVITLLLISVIFISSCGETAVTGRAIGENVSDLEEEMSELQEQLGQLISELDSYKTKYDPQPLGKVIDLEYWTISDLMEALKKEDDRIKNARSYVFIYNDDGTFFERYGDIYPIDPFYEIRISDSDIELSFSHLRMFKYDEKKYQEYQNKITVKEAVDSLLKCEKKVDCREMEVIKCTKERMSYYVIHADNFVITAMDNGEFLEIFEKFYCGLTEKN